MPTKSPEEIRIRLLLPFFDFVFDKSNEDSCVFCRHRLVRQERLQAERYEALTRLKNLIDGDTIFVHAAKMRAPVTAPSIGKIQQ